MSPRSRIAKVPSALVAASLFALNPGSSPLYAGSKTSSWQRPLNAYDSAAAERAKAGAARRLESPQCQRLLTDFADRKGASLAENLSAWGMSASEYVRLLSFLDGTKLPICERKSVQLAAVPGALQVYVCPGGPRRVNSNFALTQAENPSVTEALVIHEMLHTLGLGENPPTTFEITEAVRDRCR